jgi:hypothetical protein
MSKDAPESKEYKLKGSLLEIEKTILKRKLLAGLQDMTIDDVTDIRNILKTVQDRSRKPGFYWASLRLSPTKSTIVEVEYSSEHGTHLVSPYTEEVKDLSIVIRWGPKIEHPDATPTLEEASSEDTEYHDEIATDKVFPDDDLPPMGDNDCWSGPDESADVPLEDVDRGAYLNYLRANLKVTDNVATIGKTKVVVEEVNYLNSCLLEFVCTEEGKLLKKIYTIPLDQVENMVHIAVPSYGLHGRLGT